MRCDLRRRYNSRLDFNCFSIEKAELTVLWVIYLEPGGEDLSPAHYRYWDRQAHNQLIEDDHQWDLRAILGIFIYFKRINPE